MLKSNDLYLYRNKIGIGFLIFSFGLSNVNTALASQIVDASPIIVQPNDLSDLSQQMLEQDRINRDQELAIRGLIDDNQRLVDTALARQEDATLEQINQTLIKYRDSILERDQMSIIANGQRISKYHDLIRLTEDVDNMKDTGRALELKSHVIGEKYKVLTELKDEMMALNDKLKAEGSHENFVKTSPQQADKIKVLTQRLAEMDQKIAHFDGILAAKDQQITQLMNKTQQQDLDLKAKDDSIRWLKQVLEVTKNKAQYYQLTSQQDKITVQQVQKQVQQIKDDFTQRLKNFDEFEKAIVSFKSQVSRLSGQLSQKQQQVDLLKSELENKITESNSEDRLKLARQLINLQEQEASLLVEELSLRVALNTLIDKHALDLESKTQALSNELSQNEQQVELLKTELENKITELKDQRALAAQIQDLKAQIQDKENQITAMKSTIQTDQETQGQTDTLKQQLADQQNNVDLLKQELESKITQSDQMTSMMSDYQKKLESRDNAYNEQLGQIADLNARLQAKEAQIVKIKKDLYDLQELIKNKNRDLQVKDLNFSMMQRNNSDVQAVEIKGLRTELALARQQLLGMPRSDEIDFLRTGFKKATMQLKQKDEMISQIKANADEYEKEFKEQSLKVQSLKDQLQSAYEEIHRNDEDIKNKDLEIVRLKESSTIKEGDLQDQIKKLQSNAHDNIVAAGLRVQLKQKDAMLAQTKANADEYARKFKEQSLEFQSLKEQLQNAYDEINRRNEDLKYKKLELVRFKERSTIKEGDLQDKITALTKELKATGKVPVSNIQEILPSKNDPLREKLKQALDKINEQGRLISILVQKLQDAGQSVNITRL